MIYDLFGNVMTTVQTAQLDPALSMPNFFIVGAAKAGTTSLYAYLSTHPEVFMSPVKEPHYFSSFEVRPEFDNFEPAIRSPAVYQALFRGSTGYCAIGEASPSYLCEPDVAIRIRAAIPRARIIISVRNPVERAFSHYLMEFHAGRESLSFKDAVMKDMSRQPKGWGTAFQYVELGLYYEQVNRYLNVFGPERVLVVICEELATDARVVMGNVAEFLGVNPRGFSQSSLERVHNPFEASSSWAARVLLRSRPLRVWAKRLLPQTLRTMVRDRFLFAEYVKPKMDESTRQWLYGMYREDIDKLEILLGRDLRVLRTNK